MEEGVAEKKDDGAKANQISSILLLFLIMTLLAFWMVVLKGWSNDGRTLQLALTLVTCHQMAFLTLVGALVWVVIGRRRIAIYGTLCLIVALWAPMAAGLVERQLTGTSVSGRILEAAGLRTTYTKFYESVLVMYGYGGNSRS